MVRIGGYCIPDILFTGIYIEIVHCLEQTELSVQLLVVDRPGYFGSSDSDRKPK